VSSDSMIVTVAYRMALHPPFATFGDVLSR
jgi:hypothetical protein